VALGQGGAAVGGQVSAALLEGCQELLHDLLAARVRAVQQQEERR
jgi:hypothetical protein